MTTEVREAAARLEAEQTSDVPQRSTEAAVPDKRMTTAPRLPTSCPMNQQLRRIIEEVYKDRLLVIKTCSGGADVFRIPDKEADINKLDLRPADIIRMQDRLGKIYKLQHEIGRLAAYISGEPHDQDGEFKIAPAATKTLEARWGNKVRNAGAAMQKLRQFASARGTDDRESGSHDRNGEDDLNTAPTPRMLRSAAFGPGSEGAPQHISNSRDTSAGSEQGHGYEAEPGIGHVDEVILAYAAMLNFRRNSAGR